MNLYWELRECWNDNSVKLNFTKAGYLFFPFNIGFKPCTLRTCYNLNRVLR